MNNEQQRKELQKTLKPLIKQCVKDVLLEEGILAKIVSEVVQGMQPLHERKQKNNNKQEKIKKEKLMHAQLAQEQWKKETERKRKLLDATGFKGVDLFEGTEPLKTAGDPTGTTAIPGAFSDIGPEDPGVDITGMMKLAKNRWKDLI